MIAQVKGSYQVIRKFYSEVFIDFSDIIPLMADDKPQDIENKTLDQIETPKSKPKKPKKDRDMVGLAIALVLTITTVGLIVWWYLEISKV